MIKRAFFSFSDSDFATADLVDVPTSREELISAFTPNNIGFHRVVSTPEKYPIELVVQVRGL